MRKSMLLLCAAVCILRAGDPAPARSLPSLPSLPSPPSAALWKVSLAAVAAANIMDVHSSWGKPELNPGLAGSSGTFGPQGALIKAGIVGGVLAVEYLFLRRHPSRAAARAFAFVNFACASTTAAVALHNYSLPPR